MERLFDAFRAEDTDAFDDLLIAEYAHHNPQAGTGRQAAKDFFGPVGPIEVEVHRAIAEGDLVVVHSHYENWNMAGVDISASRTRARSSSTGTCSSRSRTRQPAGATCSAS